MTSQLLSCKQEAGDGQTDKQTTELCALCEMAESLENIGDISPDLANEDVGESLVEVENSSERQGEERKARFFVEKDLESILEQSQSSGTKRNTKWVVKLFQGKKLLLCFEFNKVIEQNDHVVNLPKGTGIR